MVSVQRLAYRAFGRIPRPVRLRLVRWGSPNYTMGALVAVRRDNGDVLLQRHEHRSDWGLPGGLVRRGERPVDGARREVFEETGLHLEIDDDPVVVIDPRAQRVDVVFVASLPDGCTPEAVAAEVIEVAWWQPHNLPPLHSHSVEALNALARRGRWESVSD